MERERCELKPNLPWITVTAQVNGAAWQIMFGTAPPHYLTNELAVFLRETTVPVSNKILWTTAETFGIPCGHELAKSTPDTSNRWTFRDDKPFAVEFGTGDSPLGFSTISLDNTGRTIMSRRICQSRLDASGREYVTSWWEHAQLTIASDSVAVTARKILQCRFTDMDKSYHANVCDGTQSILTIHQGAREKAIYFNNYFPSNLLEFVDVLETVLSEPRYTNVIWRSIGSSPVDDFELRRHME